MLEERIVRVGVVHKHFGRLFRAAEIALAHLQAGNQQLTGSAHRHPPAALAGDEGMDARKRTPDRNVGFLDGHVLAHDIGRRLRGAVAVEHAELGHGEAGHLLAAGVQAHQGLVLREVDGELRGHLRGHHRMRDAVLLEVFVQGEEVQPDLLRDDIQGRAGRERRGEIAHVGVESETGVGRGMGILRDVQGCVIVPGEDRDVPVAELHALGDTGRSAGIEQDEQVIRRGSGDIRLALGQGLDLVRRQDRPLITADEAFQAGIGDEQGGSRILDHEGEALGRIGRVQRLVGAAGLQDAERSDDHELVPVQDDGHHPAGLHDRSDMGGEPVRQRVQFRIGERRIAEDDGRMVGILGDILAEKVQEGHVRVTGEGFRVEGIGFGHLLFRREREVSDLVGLSHGQQAGGETVRKLLQDSLRVLVGTVAAGQLERAVLGRGQAEGEGIVPHFGFRVVRTVERDGEARSQVADTIFVGIVPESGRALGLLLPVPNQFFQGLFRGPFHQDRTLAASRREERLGIGIPDGNGDAESGGQQDVRVTGETLAKRIQVLGSKRNGTFNPLHLARSASMQIGNQARIQIGAGRKMFDEPGTGLFRARGRRFGNGLTHVALDFT